jgi:hypothetical protein
MRIRRVSFPTGRPVKIVAVELNEHKVIVRSDGRTQQASTVAIEPESFERMRSGYMCPLCYEDQEPPFPDACHFCGFAMRDRQAEALSEHYIGNIHIGPSTTLEDEKLIMQEMREREARELGLWTPPGTWI